MGDAKAWHELAGRGGGEWLKLTRFITMPSCAGLNCSRIIAELRVPEF
jgi:hypothetical protein